MKVHGRNLLQMENLGSQELIRMQMQKQMVKQNLMEQIKQKEIKRSTERLMIEQENRQMEEKIKREFEKNHQKIQSHMQKLKESSTGHCISKPSSAQTPLINTQLSQNYVLKHRNTEDYSTLTDTSDSKKPNLQSTFQQEEQELKRLRARLEEVMG